MKVQVSDTVKRAIVDGGTFFTADLIKLYAKADEVNKAKMRIAFPLECAAYDAWYADPNGNVPDEVDMLWEF